MLYCNEKKPYIFVSYSHKDTDKAIDIINHMVADGYNVWFDEGIDPGTEWDENIAKHINECSYFIAIISKNYIQSKNCKDELNYSRDLDKQQFLVYIEEVSLPSGMAMRMNRIQSVFLHKYDNNEEGQSKIYSAQGLSKTKISDQAPVGWKPYGKKHTHENLSDTDALAIVPEQKVEESPKGVSDTPKVSLEKKKWIGIGGGALLLILVILFLALKGCGSSKEDPESSTTEAVETTKQSTEAKTETTTTQTVTEAASSLPAEETPAVTDPATETPTQAPTTDPYAAENIKELQVSFALDGQSKKMVYSNTIGSADDPQMRVILRSIKTIDTRSDGLSELELMVTVVSNPNHATYSDMIYVAYGKDDCILFSDYMKVIDDNKELVVNQDYKVRIYVPTILERLYFYKIATDDTNVPTPKEIEKDRYKTWPQYLGCTAPDNVMIAMTTTTGCADDASARVNFHILDATVSEAVSGNRSVTITFQPEIEYNSEDYNLNSLYFRFRSYDTDMKFSRYIYVKLSLDEGETFQSFGYYQLTFTILDTDCMVIPYSEYDLDNNYQWFAQKYNEDQYYFWLPTCETGAVEDPEFRVRFKMTGIAEKDGLPYLKFTATVISNPNNCTEGRFYCEILDKNQKAIDGKGGFWRITSDEIEVGKEFYFSSKLSLYMPNVFNYIHFYANEGSIDVPEKK